MCGTCSTIYFSRQDEVWISVKLLGCYHLLLRLNCFHYSMFLNICLLSNGLAYIFFLSQIRCSADSESRCDFFPPLIKHRCMSGMEWQFKKILVDSMKAFVLIIVNINNNFQDFVLLIFTWRDFVVWWGVRTVILALMLEKHWEPLQMFLDLHCRFL